MTLWHAGLIEPSDCGERSAVNEDVALSRKLRPIAQMEALVKLVETSVIDECTEELRKQLEPHQLGMAITDGPIIAVKVLRGWLTAIVRTRSRRRGRHWIRSSWRRRRAL